MSKYHDNTTTMDDQNCLVEALATHGKKARLAKDLVDGDQLTGYQGDKRQNRAHVIIPRIQVGGASNDIGFRREKDGTFTAVISEYDSHTYGPEWLSKIRKTYVEKKKVKELNAAGYTNIQREEIPTKNGTRVRLTATPPAQYTQAAQVGFSRR